MELGLLCRCSWLYTFAISRRCDDYECICGGDSRGRQVGRDVVYMCNLMSEGKYYITIS